MVATACRRRTAGFSLLETLVSLAIVMVFAGVLLERLRYYQEAAEKANIEYVVNTLKLALQVRIGRDLVRHMPVDYAAVARENPVSWLEAPMQGYRGEPGPAEARLLTAGSWYFDRDTRELVYLPLRDGYAAPDRTGLRRVRFQARLVRAENGARKDDAAVIGVQFGPAQSRTSSGSSA